MSRRCHECSHLNPDQAVYCHHDGVALNGSGGAAREGASIDFSTWAFPQPFVFPSGKSCRNFLQFALACNESLKDSLPILQQGFFESFFASLGRADLAMAARAAATSPDPERGLDELLAKLPGSPLSPAQLQVEPTQIAAGVVQVGEDRSFEVILTNKGDRLLHGKALVDDCPWLALGPSGTSEKSFKFTKQDTLVVRVCGNRLRAFGELQKGQIVLESAGGGATITVQVRVPVKPFAEGVLSGVQTPRQLAARAKENVAAAAALIEAGAVARWYEVNGWSYPVQGPTASGTAAVQQYFEALGLVRSPKVEVSEQSIRLRGNPGDRLEYAVSVMTQEKRAVVAHGVSDQPWLTVGRTNFRGQKATIPLLIEDVPDEPGRSVTANLKVTANGNQRFDVPVTLTIGERTPGYVQRSKPAPAPVQEPPPAPVPLVAPPPPPEPSPFDFHSAPSAKSAPAPNPFDFSAPAPVSVPVVVPAPLPVPVVVLEPPPPAPEPEWRVSPAPSAAPVPVVLEPVEQVTAVAPTPVSPAPAAAPARFPWQRFVPIGIVVVGLLTAVIRDSFFRPAEDLPLPEIDWANPLLDVHFHETILPKDYLTAPTMRFGLGLPDPDDRKKFKTKLIYDEHGRTCNVCVRIDQKIEYLWGLEQGAWRGPILTPLGWDKERKNRLIGARATWARTGPPNIAITQIVEIVPGGLSADGKKRLLDTCLVRYDITNEDSIAHKVGLRFMLDTFIGNNDGVPFTIAGSSELCDTRKEFNSPELVPDFISALERQDLKSPGIVAHLSLKYGGGLEAPSRVTLGAWPDARLRLQPGGANAQQQNTRWDVPVLDMALAKNAQNPDGDSAVTLYWDEKEVAPKKTRMVGFAYGLGQVAGEKGGGSLGLTAGGELVDGKEFTLTAYVKNPAPGTLITLTLPRGLTLAGSSDKQAVPPIPPGSASSYSPVMWRVKANRSGILSVKVTLDSGAMLQHRLVIRSPEIFK